MKYPIKIHSSDDKVVLLTAVIPMPKELITLLMTWLSSIILWTATIFSLATPAVGLGSHKSFPSRIFLILSVVNSSFATYSITKTTTNPLGAREICKSPQKCSLVECFFPTSENLCHCTKQASISQFVYCCGCNWGICVPPTHCGPF